MSSYSKLTYGDILPALIRRIFKREEKTMARIVVFDSGTTFLYNNGDIVGTYSRKRDAVRGAKRRGLIVA